MLDLNELERQEQFYTRRYRKYMQIENSLNKTAESLDAQGFDNAELTIAAELAHKRWAAYAQLQCQLWVLIKAVKSYNNAKADVDAVDALVEEVNNESE